MTRATRNALLGIAGVLTAGLVPLVYRWLNPRPTRRPKLSTVLASASPRYAEDAADVTELAHFRSRREAA